MKIQILFSLLWVSIAAQAADPIKIGKVFVIPNASLELNSYEAQHNKLKLIACGEFVYFPFGPLQSASKIKESPLKIFSLKAKKTKQTSGTFEFQFLSLKNSRLVLYLKKPTEEGAISSYILAGKISDPEVEFSNQLRVGITKESFINLFFEKSDAAWAKAFDQIELSSCVDGITHKYNFSKGKLISVEFLSDTHWNISETP